MTRFLDGPAKGKRLMLKRTPILLRVTFSAKGIDALNEITDEPTDAETMVVYRFKARLGNCHVNIRGGRGGFFPIVEYSVFPTQPDDATMRDTTLWREWCEAHRNECPEADPRS